MRCREAWSISLDSFSRDHMFKSCRRYSILLDKFKTKEGFIIIKISKQEKDYLIANGIGYGENGIKSTSTHHKSWRVTESKRCMYLLREYRNKTITASVK